MARRSDHSRDELYEMALAAAREIAEAEGLRGLTARRVAAKIGYSAGTLYNLFENLDDLIVHLNGGTLDALYEALADARPDGEPEAALGAMARTYIGFTGAHPNLWNILFEHRLPEGQELPEGHHAKVRRLLGLLEGALAPLFPPGRERERLHSARVLWCGLHGICSLTSAGASPESATAMANSLVTNYVAGLRYGNARATGPLRPA
ncbi:MAG: TetR/AcrR family transcriptional regulator [Alphaproteobacteria bacterium]